jgi:hypothetical protein
MAGCPRGPPWGVAVALGAVHLRSRLRPTRRPQPPAIRLRIIAVDSLLLCGVCKPRRGAAHVRLVCCCVWLLLCASAELLHVCTVCLVMSSLLHLVAGFRLHVREPFTLTVRSVHISECRNTRTPSNGHTAREPGARECGACWCDECLRRLMLADPASGLVNKMCPVSVTCQAQQPN